MEPSKFQIYLTANEIFSNSNKAVTLVSTRNIGELREGKVFYSIYEAFYLIEKKLATVLKKDKPLDISEIKQIFAKKDKNFYIKYLIFKKLREKGYIVKTALKFGAEFRVYEKSSSLREAAGDGGRVKTSHAKYLVYPLNHSEKINIEEFIAKTRISHSVAKKLLLAIVDSEDSVLFYEVDWLKI